MYFKFLRQSKFNHNWMRSLKLGFVLVLAASAVLITPTVLAQERVNPAADYQPDFVRGTTQSLESKISPAPPAPQLGRWMEKTPLPIPRTEMTWSAVYDGKVHVIGGYDYRGGFQGRFHQVYDPKANAWAEKAPIPQGANHIGLAVLGDNIYAVGGFLEQNKTPHDKVFAYNVPADRWTELAPLPKPLGAIATVALNGKIHAIGGRDTTSVGDHYVYDPATNTWSELAPLPGARDHAGAVVVNGFIHVLGGRFNQFEYNTNLHHVYSPNTNQWKERAPIPTPRSGHGAVWYRDRLFVFGGEGNGFVYGQVEAYNPTTNSWQSYAAMPTPRHGMGASLVDDTVYIAGGGPVTGGSLMTSTNEAFTLGTQRQ
jgi:N-acetylneuraminic acid mutarotase